MITKIKVWRSPANEVRVYVETDEPIPGEPQASLRRLEGCYYLTGNHWHPAKSWDGNLSDEHKAEARRLSIKDGKWTTWYAPTAPVKPVEKQPDAKELARQEKAKAEQTFIDAHGGVVEACSGRESLGEFVILTDRRTRTDRVLVSAGYFYDDDWQSEGENAGWYTRLCEPTAEEKQSAEYQKLAERVAQDAQFEAAAQARANLEGQRIAILDGLQDKSDACEEGRHSECSHVLHDLCQCECHKPAPKTETFIPSVGPSDADFTRQFEHDTGVKTLRDDGGRDLGFYDFNDLKIAAGEVHISGACDPDHFNHKCGPCYDNRCQCSCHQPVPAGADFYDHRLNEYQQMRSQASGSALIAPTPEAHSETVAMPVLYCIAPNEAGRWELAINGMIFHRTYAHKSSAYRAARREVARHA